MKFVKILLFVALALCVRWDGNSAQSVVASTIVENGNEQLMRPSSFPNILASYVATAKTLLQQPIFFFRHWVDQVVRVSSKILSKILGHVKADSTPTKKGGELTTEKKEIVLEEKAKAVDVPIIDISPLMDPQATGEDVTKVAKQIGKACEEVGFFIIRGHGVDDNIIQAAWKTTREFFDLPLDEKLMYVKPQHENPFGYSKLGGEVLSVGKAAQNSDKTNQTSSSTASITSAPDLKELFSLGPSNPDAGFPPPSFPRTSPRF